MRARLSTHDLSSTLRVAVARLSRRLRAEKEDDKLNDTQTSTLAFLVREGSGTIGRLSEHEHVKPPSMNRTVNHLEHAGYIERTAHADDGRKVVVVPTPSGRRLVEETRRRRDAWLHQRLNALSTDQRATLAEAAAILRELADS
ncbi:MarR family transcriptional regulator [Leifsonia xyli subsp. cynodontis DSM 46306]|uniref:HTH marR-type domain-containing protein n=1 Tax=Leifsonia xyli subsp. cynodontis DSM 46306 TaxID=1389489 RepID=U3PAF6_LEIXC|nr:MarR family transcriptional regulator [Leifsonia xyli]AGW42509.1 MarR family transcriptional regulator [Leifsonia xyli subsp. cynodontis DSM 46306]